MTTIIPVVDPAAVSTSQEIGDVEADLARARFLTVLNETVPRIELQPIIHIQSGVRVGAEALSRFPGSAAPDAWFRAAHALGVGDDLELRVVHEVVRQLDQHRGFVGVNVSPQVLLDPRFVDLLVVGRGADLVVEMTDQTAAPRIPILRSRFDQLRDLGVRIAVHVSELGPDTSQLIALTQPDVVKLDRTLTAALAAGRTALADAEPFFTYCRHEGVFVVAVGVQHRDDLVALAALGVDASQGHALAATVSEASPATVGPAT